MNLKTKGENTVLTSHFLYCCIVQDTLLALEALSKFAFHETNREFYRMTLYLYGAGQDWGPHQLDLNRTNFAQLHEIEVGHLLWFEAIIK